MSRFDRLNRWLLARYERPTERARDAAFAQAKRQITDAAAQSLLAAQLSELDDSLIAHALQKWGPRLDYLSDRAYRLLVAARDDAPVRPIDPARQDSFALEAELGHLPLADAFHRLGDAEPQLRVVERHVLAGGKFRSAEVSKLLGSGSSHDALLQTHTAREVAMVYLSIQSRHKPVGVKSYFERFGGSRYIRSDFKRP